MVFLGMAKKRRTRTLPLGQLVGNLIGKSTQALEEQKLKVNVADLIRSRTMREKIAPTEPVTPKVKWIDGWN
jgi:hypothetical protein